MNNKTVPEHLNFLEYHRHLAWLAHRGLEPRHYPDDQYKNSPRKLNPRSIYHVMQDRDLTNADLRFAEFSQNDLRRCNLSNADLRETTFTRTHLIYVTLFDADLRKSKFIDCDLNGTNFENADLRGASFNKGTSLAGCDLHRARLEDVEGIASEDEEALLWATIRDGILDRSLKLTMNTWHYGAYYEESLQAWIDTSGERTREENLCKTAHCLAGWAQVFSKNHETWADDPGRAGGRLLPRHAHLFFKSDGYVWQLLEEERNQLREREKKV